MRQLLEAEPEAHNGQQAEQQAKMAEGEWLKKYTWLSCAHFSLASSSLLFSHPSSPLSLLPPSPHKK